MSKTEGLSWQPWLAGIVAAVAVGFLATLLLGYWYQHIMGVGTPNEVHNLHWSVRAAGSFWLYGSTGLAGWGAYRWFKGGPAERNEWGEVSE